MIFDKLVALKISLDFYKKSKNPLKKLLYYMLLKSIINKVKTIKKSIITFEILSEFQQFIQVTDSNNHSNIKSYEYTYSNKYAQEIAIEQQSGLEDINILLRHKDNSIEIVFPFTPQFRVNKIYKDSIESDSKVIPDKYTIIINNNIRNYIYDFIISYMKGDFNNE